MTSKFLNKYRIPSTRLQNWDYTSNAAYFITICTHNRARYFGNIKEGIMYLSEIGQLAEEYWREIPNHFPFVELGNFVIMPNHMHGILILNHPISTLHSNIPEPNTPVETLHCNVSQPNNPQPKINVKTLHCNVSQSNNPQPKIIVKTLHCNVSLSNNNHENNHESNETLQCNVSTGNLTMATISPKRGSIATIIRSYKSIVTRTARNIYPDFAWQSRYYDRIIKNATAFENIQNYIQENPKNWKRDDFYL